MADFERKIKDIAQSLRGLVAKVGVARSNPEEARKIESLLQDLDRLARDADDEVDRYRRKAKRASAH